MVEALPNVSSERVSRVSQSALPHKHVFSKPVFFRSKAQQRSFDDEQAIMPSWKALPLEVKYMILHQSVSLAIDSVASANSLRFDLRTAKQIYAFMQLARGLQHYIVKRFDLRQFVTRALERAASADDPNCGQRSAEGIIALLKAAPEMQNELVKAIISHTKSAQVGMSAAFEAGPWRDWKDGESVDGSLKLGPVPPGMSNGEMSKAIGAWLARQIVWWRRVDVCHRALVM